MLPSNPIMLMVPLCLGNSKPAQLARLVDVRTTYLKMGKKGNNSFKEMTNDFSSDYLL